MHASYSTRGGEDQAVNDLEREMTLRGNTVMRFSSSNDEERPITFVRAPHNRRASRRLERAIYDFRPDVIHIHNTWWTLSPTVITTATKNAATVISLHNYRTHCIAGDFLRHGKPCTKCLGKRVAAQGVAFGCYRDNIALSAQAAITSTVLHRNIRVAATAGRLLITAPTKFSADLHARGGLPQSALRVVSNLLSVDDQGTRTGTHTLDFAYVGRLSHEKGVVDLLDLWSRARDEVPELHSARLFIAGEGAALESPEEVPGVVMLGRLTRQEVLRLMARSLALFFPSICFENQPMTVLEAMAVGTPVIYNRGGAVDEVAGPGQPAFDLKSYDSFVDAIRLCLDPVRAARISNEGRERVAQRYSTEVVAKGWLAVYEDAMRQFVTHSPPMRRPEHIGE